MACTVCSSVYVVIYWRIPWVFSIYICQAKYYLVCKNQVYRLAVVATRHRRYFLLRGQAYAYTLLLLLSFRLYGDQWPRQLWFKNMSRTLSCGIVHNSYKTAPSHFLTTDSGVFKGGGTRVSVPPPRDVRKKCALPVIKCHRTWHRLLTAFRSAWMF